MLSVCLITYNHEKYIRQALESILLQQVNFSLEIIVADDCSPDKTRDIVDEYKKKYPDLIKLLYQQKNVGPGKNFVDLINSAAGKYIAYLEGDDYWTDPLKLQKQFDLMEAYPDVSMCYHKIKWDFAYDSPKWEKLATEGPNDSDPERVDVAGVLKRGWFIRSCSMFFRNIQLPAGFEKLYIGDFPLHVLLAHTGDICFINETMAAYRINEHGLSETILITDDISKRNLKCRENIEMYEYINQHTGYAYDKQIKQLIFDSLYSHWHFLSKRNTAVFLSEITFWIKKKGLFFVIANMFKKVKRHLFPGNKISALQ